MPEKTVQNYNIFPALTIKTLSLHSISKKREQFVRILIVIYSNNKLKINYEKVKFYGSSCMWAAMPKCLQ